MATYTNDWEAGRRAGFLEALYIAQALMGSSPMPEVKRGARIIASELEKIISSGEAGNDTTAIQRRESPTVARYRNAARPHHKRLSKRHLRTYVASTAPSPASRDAQRTLITWPKTRSG